MKRYFVVIGSGLRSDEFFVATLTDHSRAPKVIAGPYEHASQAWAEAERRAHGMHSPAYYTVLPSELSAVVSPENPGPRACWEVTE